MVISCQSWPCHCLLHMRAHVQVTAVGEKCDVWCCLSEGLEELTRSLQKAVQVARKLHNPIPGEACLVQCTALGVVGRDLLMPWARAVVRSRPSPSKLKLFFVDLGFTLVVHHNLSKCDRARHVWPSSTRTGCGTVPV